MSGVLGISSERPIHLPLPESQRSEHAILPSVKIMIQLQPPSRENRHEVLQKSQTSSFTTLNSDNKWSKVNRTQQIQKPYHHFGHLLALC
jgi:hypothetical protein